MSSTTLLLDTAAWRLELIVVARARLSSTERMAISRDAERGLLLRLIPGVYAERIAYEALTPEEQYIVRMRALRATTPGPLVLSHYSAAVLHGLPVCASASSGSTSPSIARTPGTATASRITSSRSTAWMPPLSRS